MNWISNVVRPKIRSFLKRETPENLWIKCPETGQLVFFKDVEANQFVIPGSNYHMRMGATARLKSMFDGETWLDVGVPEVPADVPLVNDASSDVFCRPVDFSKFALTYAGGQKNLSIAGMTVAVIREELLERAPKELPIYLRYATHAKERSLYNTPPVFGIYVLHLVLEHLLAEGGLEEMARRNERKAAKLYAAIDGSGGFYRGHARKDSRSWMNVTFRLPFEELEGRFVKEATAAGLDGLKGHRSVGGIRASIYNAFPEAGVDALVDFMADFQRRAG